MSIAARDNIKPFPEEEIINTAQKLDEIQLTAKVYLKNYSHLSSPEVVQVAEAIVSGDFLVDPVLFVAYKSLYSRLLVSAPEHVDGGRLLNNLFKRLYKPFLAAGVI